MEQFAPYSLAIASLALLALIALGLSPAAGLARNAAGKSPGSLPDPDYGDRNYRICRAYQNAAEMMGTFAAVIAAAILAGASPFWVNLFAALAVLSRIVLVYVHVQGIGSGEPGPRTYVYVFGWAMAALIALLALVAALF